MPGKRTKPLDERLDVSVVRPPEDAGPAVPDEEAVRRGLAPLLVEELEDLRRIHRRRL
jgi:hypothetical protein